MLSDSYRDCTEYREILRIFQKSSSSQDNFLWQSLPLGKYIIHPRHLEIDFVSRGISIYFDSGKYRLANDFPLYVKLGHRNTVFKVNEFRVGHDCLQFSFPETLKTPELRSQTRMNFEDQEQVLALKPTLSSQGSEMGNELLVRLSDISKNGAGLMVSENNRSFLKNNRFLWVTSVNEESLAEPILAEVVYMTGDVDRKFSRRKQREMKVGLKLSSDFPLEMFPSS